MMDPAIGGTHMKLVSPSSAHAAMKIKIALIITWTCIAVLETRSQDTEIDASKPTNFYSLLDNTLEWVSSPEMNIYGYRGKLMIAPSEFHLILGELPLLYNDVSAKFGIGDIRARYFYLPYKNYEKFFGSFGPSIDIYVPSGSREDGLGTGRWTIAPGVTAGLMLADWIQFFPILSYQYSSKPVGSSVPEAMNKAMHGITFQLRTPVVFSPKFFMQIVPKYQMNDIGDENRDRYVQEILAVYSIAPKLQISGFYNGNFKDKLHQFNLGVTVFLVE